MEITDTMKRIATAMMSKVAANIQDIKRYEELHMQINMVLTTEQSKRFKELQYERAFTFDELEVIKYYSLQGVMTTEFIELLWQKIKNQ